MSKFYHYKINCSSDERETVYLKTDQTTVAELTTILVDHWMECWIDQPEYFTNIYPPADNKAELVLKSMHLGDGTELISTDVLLEKAPYGSTLTVEMAWVASQKRIRYHYKE